MVVDLQKLQKQVKDLKKKKSKGGVDKLLKSKFRERTVIKKDPKATIVIPEVEEDILNDPNRFFKSTYEKEKRGLFFQ